MSYSALGGCTRSRIMIALSAGCGILRALLGRYTGLDPEKVVFSYTAYGKPELEPRGDHSVLTFNVSHADGQALYAVSRGRAVGIDLERVQHSLDYEQIVSHILAREERAALCSLTPYQRSIGFFRIWVCKEAYVKACGLGFTVAPDQFAVTLSSDGSAKLLYTQDRTNATCWSLRELPAADGYVAALAVEGQDWHLRCWRYKTAQSDTQA